VFLRFSVIEKAAIIIVASAPVIDDYSRNIGPDAFSSDAAGAARLAEKLITKRVKH
jgi:methanogenic corrinoid protein MtbC1